MSNHDSYRFAEGADAPPSLASAKPARAVGVIDFAKRSELREEHGDADCCRLRKTWLFTWDDPGSSVVVESKEAILTFMREDVLSDEFEDEEQSVTITPHVPMTEHEIEALPEFGGW